MIRFQSIQRGCFGMLVAVSALIAQGCASSTRPAQETFSSPDSAVQAFVGAVRSGSEEQLHKIFGPDADDLIGSGDPVADDQARQAFLAKYDEKHGLVDNPDGSKTLVVGQDDWPIPIPLVQNSTNGWSFDTEAGKDEIINRRVGKNELYTIEVCRAIADAQRDYAMQDPDGDGVPEYARKFVSEPGKKDGLYWKTEEGQPPSPLGPLVAEATEQGYTEAYKKAGKPVPYHGYYYRILTGQGEHANGGAYDYVVGGKMIGGFAVVAWPAEYGSSGVMTFIVNHEGVVHQQDLGEDTETKAKAMRTFGPGAGWKKVE